MDKDNIEGVGIMWRRDGGQYHLPTLDRRQEGHDREKMIIILTLIEKKLDQGALGMSDPCGTLQSALKPNSVPRI